ncbi:MAG TPA: AAA family ATPase [Solirubrobacteraceae bacterium]|jgi:ATP/maltotriose-dependent transcriptional regulator MalT
MPAPHAFLGRTTELAALDDALNAVERGAAHAMEVCGPAGIGKTRLLAELARRAGARGHVVLSGAGTELEQDLPYWVFVDALDEHAESLDPRRLERLDPLVRAELAQVLPSLAGAPSADAPGVHERYRTHRAIRELLDQVSATAPLVLILDDFHWADSASVDLLVALLHRPPPRVLLVLACRPRQLPGPLASVLDRMHRNGSLEKIELQALSREDARELVGAHADAIYDESGGNPFYLEQLARGSAPAPVGGDEVLLAGLRVPPQVAAALGEELAVLGDLARRALDGASVVGDPFEADLAALAADLPEPDLLDGLDELLGADIVRVTDIPRRFRFRHPIIRRAVYEATRGGWRIGAHQRVAAGLAGRGAGVASLAHHVERCARHGDAEAIRTLTAAGHETASRAPATAARWFQAALRLLPHGAPAQHRVELSLAAAQARIAIGHFAAGHASLLESLEIVPADAGGLRANVAASCARVEHLLGMHERAHERLLAALAELPDEPSPDAVALMVELSMDGEHRMQYGSMVEWAERAVDVAAGLGDPALHAEAVTAAARGRAVAGHVTAALAWCDRAAAMIDALPDRVIAERLVGIATLSTAELFVDRFAEANAHVERAIAIGRATGQGQQFPQLFAFLGISCYLQGQLRVAVDPLEAAVEAARLTGHAQTLSWSLYARSLVSLALGDMTTALTSAQEAVDLVDDGKPSHAAAYAALALAEASLELGRPQSIVALLERVSGGPDMPLAAPAFRASFLKRLVRARLMLGDVDAAARAAEVAQESAREGGLRFRQAEADRASAAVALHTGDAARAVELAFAAVEHNAAVGAAMEVSRSLILAGRALAATGERERAREVLARAAADLDQRGAVRFRDAAEHQLRQLGHRIHRRSHTVSSQDGVGGLSNRELEIARLIVDRRTNRQIAEELFLSQKTVETHIRNIFNKLGADSRVEVARLVERADRLTPAGS